uniref:Chemokine interleukin-8-like domain-containing protein n=1 Tax=Neogobius melanostomus TaxID=47308 RepID=A0A8C6TXQ6_9GOBI
MDLNPLCVHVFIIYKLTHVYFPVGDEKLTNCCTEVSTTPIKDPIIGVRRQPKSGNCVEALIFQTENRATFCIYRKAPWVRSSPFLIGGLKFTFYCHRL